MTWRAESVSRCLPTIWTHLRRSSDLYRPRWQVEIFFKRIKQHLRINALYGTSEIAVKAQIWIAVNVYLLAAIVNKWLSIKHNAYTTLQILSITLFAHLAAAATLTDVVIRDQSPRYDF